MSRTLKGLLILKLLITLVTGQYLFSPEVDSAEFSISDLFLTAQSPNYQENQVLGLNYVGNDSTPSDKVAVSASEAPLYGENEEIKAKIQEIAEDSVVDWRYLYVLAKYESSLNPQATNINAWEESYGLFQINVKVHNVTPAQARDIEFATQWTIDYLIQNGYTEDYIVIPLARHQGSPSIPKVINRANQIYYEAQRIN